MHATRISKARTLMLFGLVLLVAVVVDDATWIYLDVPKSSAMRMTLKLVAAGEEGTTYQRWIDLRRERMTLKSAKHFKPNLQRNTSSAILLQPNPPRLLDNP
eukprot:6465680-Amphidinium_carterae.2